MHPPQPSFGPVRSPRGRVDVTVTATDVLLRPHRKWWDLLESEWVHVPAAVLAVLAILVAGDLDTPGGIAVLVVAGAVLLAVVGLYVVVYAVVAYSLLRGALLLLTGRGRTRLRHALARELRSFEDVDGTGWALPRAALHGAVPVEDGRRARLRLTTVEGEVALSVRRRDRDRLEGIAWALGRP